MKPTASFGTGPSSWSPASTVTPPAAARWYSAPGEPTANGFGITSRTCLNLGYKRYCLTWVTSCYIIYCVFKPHHIIDVLWYHIVVFALNLGMYWNAFFPWMTSENWMTFRPSEPQTHRWNQSLRSLWTLDAAFRRSSEASMTAYRNPGLRPLHGSLSRRQPILRLSPSDQHQADDVGQSWANQAVPQIHVLPVIAGLQEAGTQIPKGPGWQFVVPWRTGFDLGCRWTDKTLGFPERTWPQRRKCWSPQWYFSGCRQCCPLSQSDVRAASDLCKSMANSSLICYITGYSNCSSICCLRQRHAVVDCWAYRWGQRDGLWALALIFLALPFGAWKFAVWIASPVSNNAATQAFGLWLHLCQLLPALFDREVRSRDLFAGLEMDGVGTTLNPENHPESSLPRAFCSYKKKQIRDPILSSKLQILQNNQVQ